MLWVARDGDGRLFLYEAKPGKNMVYKSWGPGALTELPGDIFPEVKWEDEESAEVIIMPTNRI